MLTAMTEKEFLENNIFQGLKNRNNGEDAHTIWHFSADDFLTIMDRAEELELEILGIECWEEGSEKVTKYHEDYDSHYWHRHAYEELVGKFSPCVFTATFDVPAYYLQNFIKD